MNITCPLVGASFRSSADREALKGASIGDICDLRADPDNAYDDTAVAVDLSDYHVGFIPKDMNTELYERLMSGEEATATIVSFEKPLRPILEINLP